MKHSDDLEGALKILAPQLIAAQANRDWEEEGQLIAALKPLVIAKPDLYSVPNTLAGRFWPKVSFGMADCWYWTANVDALGYGRHARLLGETRAHRFSYRYFKGDFPKHMKVLHSCDIRRYVNPDHLSIGTQADNVADMVAKGRQRSPGSPGEKNGNAVLTRHAVAEIRRLADIGWSRRHLAEHFGVSIMAVSRAARGASWK